MLLKQNEQNMMRRPSILGGGMFGALLALAASPAHAQSYPPAITATQGYVIYVDPDCYDYYGDVAQCLSKVPLNYIADAKQFPQSAAIGQSAREQVHDQSSAASPRQ